MNAAAKKTVIVNIYNFIRKAHEEPSRFIQDDFDTLRRQIDLVRRSGLPATYALKYDALTDARYQALLRENLGPADELAAWWEITGELCQKAGVRFRGKASEEFDERVNSAYSIGYEPWERKRLVDAYMAEFYRVFGRYPGTIGSWVLDTVTLDYAARAYGVAGGAICRDQMGTDGFTLWGGWPNGMYYPSRRNENLPAQTPDHQLPVPVFRLLGPDPICNFEQDLRPELAGMVYTLEPAWLPGRDARWVGWMFGCLTDEDALGVGYAQIGQENNFLWENIGPGLAPQLDLVAGLARQGKVRVATMADTARWFARTFRLTPPMTWQASRDWDESRGLAVQWYASACYRLGFLAEGGALRIRDWFLYRDEYASRYLDHAMTGAKSTFDALPLLFAQGWTAPGGPRPFVRLIDPAGREPRGRAAFCALDAATARAELRQEGGALLARFTLTPDALTLEGDCGLRFDRLPVLTGTDGRTIRLEHEGFAYDVALESGRAVPLGDGRVDLRPAGGVLRLRLGRTLPAAELFAAPDPWAGPEPVFTDPAALPPAPPEADPPSCVFPWGRPAAVALRAGAGGTVRYTLDGTAPDEHAPVYTAPLTLRRDTRLRARVFLPDGRRSEELCARYRFALPGLKLQSPTRLDARPVFSTGGIDGLLRPERGTTDFLCGRWLGTLQDLDVTALLPAPCKVARIGMGFLSHHRSGIVYPEHLELFTGPDPDHLGPAGTLPLPRGPFDREILCDDFFLPVGQTIGCFRLVARRYARMPGWCTYKGSPDVFMMADALLVQPEEEP